MCAQALALQPTAASKVRPFNIHKDLLAVANLVELCFAGSLDADGRMYINQMRQAAGNAGILDAVSRREMPLGGFVWTEGKRLVGNLSLVPHRHEGKRMHLIANVAVHPDFRRHGIARALTLAALQDVRSRGRQETWLQVDERNPAAVALYRGMGFEERTRRTSWRMYPQRELLAEAKPSAVRIRRPADWQQQLEWLKASYPRDVRWQLPIDFTLMEPGWRGSLERALSERQLRQWSAESDGKLQGVLCWQSSSLESDRLWLATPAQAEHEEQAVATLLRKAHSTLTPGRSLALNYPAGRAVEALVNAGMHATRTLIWMSYPWAKS